MNSKVVVAVWVRGRQGVKLLSAAVKNPVVFQLPTGHSHSGFFWTSKQPFSATKWMMTVALINSGFVDCGS